MREITSGRNLTLVMVCFVGAALAVSAGTVNAGLIAFDTFGAGDDYYKMSPYGVDGSSAWQAFRFVPTESGRLDAIIVALGRTGTDTVETQFNLYDGTGTTLGNLLESITVPNTVTPGLPGAVVSFDSVVRPTLISGADYWLSHTEPGAADGSDSLWFPNNQGIGGTRLTSALPAADASLPAFRVELDVVPVPGAALLGVLGLSVAGWRLRRRTT